MELSTIKNIHSSLYANRERYKTRWMDISKFCGIKVDPMYNDIKDGDKSKDLDQFSTDPSAALCVQQAADYIKGVMWGSGQNVFILEPTDEILELSDKSELNEWFGYASKRILEEMNHQNSGLVSSMSAYFYDQQAFGTSGIGAFPNSRYKVGIDENIIVFRQYGVDTLLIDEGKSGLIEFVFNEYQWRVDRIVSEFCNNLKGFDQNAFDNLPGDIKDAYNSKNLNMIFKIIHAVIPNKEFVAGAQGYKGCRYSGFWFTDKSTDFFLTENYKNMPIPVCRSEKVRGEVYGRSSGTMLLSTIRCVNGVVTELISGIEKMFRPPIGVFSSALFGDSVVDTSANGLTVLNPKFIGGGSPIVPMQDIGDPSAMVQFLLPYLNEKITSAFKIDILMDFNSKSNMTARESMQRYSIRARALAGTICQQRVEMMEPLIHRCVSIVQDAKGFGYNETDIQYGSVKEKGMNDHLIPSVVSKFMNSGRRWYKIKFSNAIDEIQSADKVDKIMQTINMVGMLMSVYPQISESVDWYNLFKDATEALGTSGLIKSEDEFKAAIEAMAQQQSQMMQAQGSQMESITNRNNALAMKEISSAENATEPRAT